MSALQPVMIFRFEVGSSCCSSLGYSRPNPQSRCVIVVECVPRLLPHLMGCLDYHDVESEGKRHFGITGCCREVA